MLVNKSAAITYQNIEFFLNVVPVFRMILVKSNKMIDDQFYTDVEASSIVACWQAQLLKAALFSKDKDMSIFASIVSSIFGTAKAPAAAVSGTSTASPAATAKPITRDEVETMIENLAEKSNQDLNWRQSIVDLMKLLKLDSSLKTREQLAKELGYTGALDGSAEMNVWLHKQVMTKLAEGGGVVPASLSVQHA
jgi:Domain of unknown function (DUF3597)